VRILALDTATENCSAALLLGERLHAREQLLSRGHAEHILPMIAELLREAAVTLPELDAIAFGCGPGAFTGVRLAASIAQGLAFGAARRVVPVSNLQALAQRVLKEAAGSERVLACNDARMHEVYCGAYQRSAGGLAHAVRADQLSAPERVRLPEGWASAGATAAGSAFQAYPQLRALPGIQVCENLWSRAAEIAQLAAPAVRAGCTVAPQEALPVYLRDDVAQPAPPVPVSR
jgi:tRNA threonylcarbamoyladenosine biosynthesis protein TsaB